jgi:TetR/AcrR family transcriptional regulator
MARQGKTAARKVRPRNAPGTRAAILDAAERIFAEAGDAGARTDAIAAAAGVNKALLYYYFKSKDGLYRAVLEKHLKEFHHQADEILDAKGSARSTVLRYVEMHFDFMSSRPYYPRLFQRMAMAGEGALNRLTRKHRLPLARKFIAVIERGIRGGEFRRVDAVHAAFSIFGLTVSYFVAAPAVRAVTGMDLYDPRNLERRREQMLDFVRHALFRSPEAVVR